MSKKTHKKAVQPKAKSRTGVKAKASAKKTVGAASKGGAKAKAKSSRSTVAARKSTAVKGAKTAASGPAKASTKTRASTKKTAAKPPAAPRSSTSIRKPVKSPPAAPVRLDITPDQVGGGLAVGSKVPAFRLPRDGGATVSLDSFAGRRLVLFFYPRASTPGCTKEAMDFSRLSSAFAALDTDVVGVSADPPRAQETFRDKHDLTVPLLSDEAHTTLERLGVWGEKSLYGKTFHGVIRTTVLIGADARVINIWRNVKVDGHADAVLNYVENL